MKKIIIPLACIFTLTFISCASTPKDDVIIDETEDLLEENLNEEIIDPVVYDEEKDVSPAEEFLDDEEINLEPLEDIEGFFESEPVILFPQEEVPVMEEEPAVEDEPPADTAPAEEPADEEDLNNSQEINNQHKTEENSYNADSKPKPSTEKNSSNTEIIDSDLEPKIEFAENLTEESYSQESESSNPQEEKEIIPSRTVTIKNNQFLDILYPGNGWVYLGETDDGTKLRYFGRKIGSSDTTFSLRSREEGKAVLHFYKNDALTGSYIDDYLEVIIKGENTTSQRITAPSYAEIVPPKPEKVVDKISQELKSEIKEASANQKAGGNNSVKPQESAGQNQNKKTTGTESKSVKTQNNEDTLLQEDNAQTVISNTSAKGSEKENEGFIKKQQKAKPSQNMSQNNSLDEENINLSGDELLAKAKKFIEEKKYEEAMQTLDTFFDRAITKLDEGYYLKGQILESNSKLRNIKEALNSYETIVNLYPQSSLWKKANERVTYLKKFYFNIW